VITGDDHTFGKGTVQTVTPLPPGEGALKITTALFFRPGGRSTQNEGVAVDVAIPSLLTTEEFGENTQDYALPGKEIPSFLSSYANALSASDRFGQVDAPVIAELAKRSHARVEQSKEFQELQAKIEKARNEEPALKLADLMRERDEAKQNGDGKGAKNGKAGKAAGDAALGTAEVGEPDEDELTPQIEEAIGVLADLVELSRRSGTLQAGSGPATSASR
jgi:carboxyl-terminal processing protease